MNRVGSRRRTKLGLELLWNYSVLLTHLHLPSRPGHVKKDTEGTKTFETPVRLFTTRQQAFDIEAESFIKSIFTVFHDAIEVFEEIF